MNEKEYIEKIIEQTGLTKEEIKNLIKEKKKEYRNFLTTSAAYDYVCKDLKIILNDKKSKNEESNMRDEDYNSDIHARYIYLNQLCAICIPPFHLFFIPNAMAFTNKLKKSSRYSLLINNIENFCITFPITL